MYHLCYWYIFSISNHFVYSSYIVFYICWFLPNYVDPVAVVAILKELGVSEQLSVIVDGESLLNDGIAILLYEIMREIVAGGQPSGSWQSEILHVVWKFVQIALGGPAFGELKSTPASDSCHLH